MKGTILYFVVLFGYASTQDVSIPRDLLEPSTTPASVVAQAPGFETLPCQVVQPEYAPCGYQPCVDPVPVTVPPVYIPPVNVPPVPEVEPEPDTERPEPIRVPPTFDTRSDPAEIEEIRSCPIGFVQSGSECVELNVSACPSGYIWRDEHCVLSRSICPLNYELEGGTCVSRRICPPNHILNHGRCVQPHPVCPSGWTWNGATCEVTDVECQPGSVLRGNECVIESITCPDGYNLVGEECVKPEPICPPGFGYDSSGFCIQIKKVCHSGSILVNGECRRTISICPPGTWQDGDQCYRLADTTTRRTTTPRPSPPKEIVHTTTPRIVVPRPPTHNLTCPQGFTLYNNLCYRCPPTYNLCNNVCQKNATCPSQPIAPCPNQPITPCPQQPIAPCPQQPITPCPQQPNAPCSQTPNQPCPRQPTAPCPNQPTTPCPQQPNAPCPQQPITPCPQQPNAPCPQTPNQPCSRQPNASCPQQPTSHCPYQPYIPLPPNYQPIPMPGKGYNIVNNVEPIVNTIHNFNNVTHPITLNNVNVNNIYIYTETQCPDGSIGTLVVKNNETISGCVDVVANRTEITNSDEEENEDEGEKKCCEVVTPRQCKKRTEDSWQCSHKRYRYCGKFCIADRLYLKPPTTTYQNQVLTIVPSHHNAAAPCFGRDCPSVDCSGCMDGSFNCSSQCYTYPCNHAGCTYLNQAEFCSVVGGHICE